MFNKMHTNILAFLTEKCINQLEYNRNNTPHCTVVVVMYGLFSW